MCIIKINRCVLILKYNRQKCYIVYIFIKPKFTDEYKQWFGRRPVRQQSNKDVLILLRL